jgi:hypothetical protein
MMICKMFRNIGVFEETLYIAIVYVELDVIRHHGRCDYLNTKREVVFRILLYCSYVRLLSVLLCTD